MQFQKEAVGSVIRRLREEQGLTQEFLSSFAGIARSHLSMIETGAKNPNFETLWKIAEALHIKPSALVEKIEQETESSIT